MDKFDAVVVGAGPAGCAAAYTLAKAGLQVLVCERGKYAGAKNMWGGAFFGPQMHELFPDFRQRGSGREVRQPPRHYPPRPGRPSDFRFPDSRHPTSHHGFITLRAKFDRWMAEKVEQAGAIVATSLQADDLIRGKAIKGVKAGNEEFPADVVILAEGVNSLLTEKPDSASPTPRTI